MTTIPMKGLPLRPDIKVFVVDDSALTRKVLCDMITKTPGMSVAGTAANGKEALERIALAAPDIVCTDFHMPVMDGGELIRRLMQRNPLPVLVVSISVQADETENIFHLLEAGALDVIAKPRMLPAGGEGKMQQVADELTSKIRILSGVYVFRRRTDQVPVDVQPAAVKYDALMLHALPLPTLVAIGASTGGPQALKEVLSQLTRPLAFPVVCIQHISAGFQDGLLHWLRNEIPHPVELAQDGQRPCAGIVYFAAESRHLVFDSRGYFAYRDQAPVDGIRPAIDLLFQSAVAPYGKGVYGILLSGMGRDGARGMKNIVEGGGTTVAQSEESCVVFGMPKAAVELGAASFSLAPKQIAELLNAKSAQP